MGRGEGERKWMAVILGAGMRDVGQGEIGGEAGNEMKEGF